MTTIDLRDFDGRVNERVAFLKACADEFAASGILSPADVRFTKTAPPFLAEAYFLLSEAYKDHKLPTDARTQEPKIAALTALSVAAVAPFRPINPLNVKQPATYVANAWFGLFCASAIVNNSFADLGNDQFRKAINFLHHLRMPCINEYIASVSIAGKRGKDLFEIDMSKGELAMADGLVLMFELLLQRSR